MNIKELLLLNFRSYDKLKIKFKNGINIIIGNNAEGKTNILESIYYLSITKSYRTTDEKNLIKYDKNSFKISTKIYNNGIMKKMTIQYEKGKKRTFINENYIKKISDYITNFNVILISPDDIEIIKGSPNERRNLINISISQVSKKYIEINNEYNKLLKMRNDYLKKIYTNSIADKRYFNIITEKMIDRAVLIYNERKKMIDLINENISRVYKNIVGKGKLKVKYETNFEINDFKIDNLRQNLNTLYEKVEYKEINLGVTSYGPHRDDIIFELDGQNIKNFGSQGQQKLALIALKLSLILIYERITGSKPVLLLDDVFSELDKNKKNALISYINEAGQVIITANDTKNISKKIIEMSEIFEIKNKKLIGKGEKNGK